ncbi:MAG: pyridoxal-phosphate dependent enzyme [Planctomycetota bacterium]
MKYYENILDTIGHTPLVRMNRIFGDSKGLCLAKVEAFNPGGSVKDRIGVNMINAAEREGHLKPGGTIIECTSGNTGFGLALVAAVRGYRAIFTMPDKVAPEKSRLLKAIGAEVRLCPTAVEPDDPRSYYSVARKLHAEIENSYYPNQYHNPWNPDAHVHSTGPEIWEDTAGRITHFVAGMGTGGTISGIGKVLKGHNPEVRVIGSDPVGSLYAEYARTGELTEAHTYLVEGIGEDFLPTTIDFSVIDEVIQIGDRESFAWARRLAREEGMLSGSSAGNAVGAAAEVAKRLGPDDVMVVLIPDTGERYLSKVYDDDWLRRHQLIDSPMSMTAGEILAEGSSRRGLLQVGPGATIAEAVAVMRENDISQLPVLDGDRMVGSVREREVIEALLKGDSATDRKVEEIMTEPFPELPESATADEILACLDGPSAAVLIGHGDHRRIITKYDLIHSVRGKARS